MKRILMILMCSLMLTACAAKDNTTPTETDPTETTAHETQETTIETLSTEESTEAEGTTFTVYTPNENLDGFFTTEFQGDKENVVDVLISAGVLTEDVKVNSITREEATIHVDFNSAFADLINTMGTTGEGMIMGCVVNTFLSAHGAETMMITVDGEVLESGHVVYDFPMEMVE